MRSATGAIVGAALLFAVPVGRARAQARDDEAAPKPKLDGNASGAPVAGGAAPATPPAVPSPPSLEIVPPGPLRRGSEVILRGIGNVKASNLTLKLDDTPLVLAADQVPGSFAFAVPASGTNVPPLGWHHAVASVMADDSHTAPRTIDLGTRDLKADDRQFAVTDLLPRVSYPKNGAYEVVVVGTGFSDRGDDQVVFINGRKVDVCWETASRPVCGKTVQLPTGAVGDGPDSAGGASPTNQPSWLFGRINSDRELVLSGLSEKAYRGPTTIQVALGSEPPSPPRTVVLSRLRETLAPLLAGGITVILFVLIVAAVRRSMPTKTADGFPVGPIGALLLDRDTETFSLSRFQFFAWTAVAVFSYAFLAIARTLVQGRLDLPDVPSTLPGIVFISAGTSIGAMGVTSLRGPKGTGPVRPSFADLVSSGGLVGVDRFQFLVWTIVGVLSFLLVVLQSDPATVTSLPSLPEGFLYLSGISAFGYLGGKFARKPGPVIDSAVVESTQERVKIAIVGRNLSPVTARIQGMDVARYLPSANQGTPLVQVPSNEILTDDGTTPRRFYLSLTAVNPAWVPAKPEPSESPSTQPPAANPQPAKITPAGPAAPLVPGEPVPGVAQSAVPASAPQPPPSDRTVTLTLVNPDGQISETMVAMPMVADSLVKVLS